MGMYRGGRWEETKITFGGARGGAAIVGEGCAPRSPGVDKVDVVHPLVQSVTLPLLSGNALTCIYTWIGPIAGARVCRGGDKRPPVHPPRLITATLGQPVIRGVAEAHLGHYLTGPDEPLDNGVEVDPVPRVDAPA
jgi:hypothetical protein